MVLYPTGITGEIFQCVASLDHWATAAPVWHRGLQLILLAYAPGSPFMIGNMLGNRKSAIKKRREAANPRPLSGLSWPVTDAKSKERGSTPTNKAVWEAAIKAVDDTAATAVKREKNWRYGYVKHVEANVKASLKSPAAALKVAEAGLAAAHKLFQFVRDGKETSLLEAMDTYTSGSLETATIKGAGPKRGAAQLSIPYGGKAGLPYSDFETQRTREISGAALKAQLAAWVSEGTIEPDCAAALAAVADHPEWLDLSDHYFVLLGAGSAMVRLGGIFRAVVWVQCCVDARCGGVARFPGHFPRARYDTSARTSLIDFGVMSYSAGPAAAAAGVGCEHLRGGHRSQARVGEAHQDGARVERHVYLPSARIEAQGQSNEGHDRRRARGGGGSRPPERDAGACHLARESLPPEACHRGELHLPGRRPPRSALSGACPPHSSLSLSRSLCCPCTLLSLSRWQPPLRAPLEPQACDAIISKLAEVRPDLALAFLCTPTDAHAVPKNAHDAAEANAANAPWWTGLVPMLVPNATKPVRSDDNQDMYYVDGVVAAQGPNYILAKRLQHWRAMLEFSRGHTVSSNIAPSTATASVVHNAQFAAAYGGMHHFKPMEVMYAETSNAVMGALLIHDVRNPAAPARAGAKLDNPLHIFKNGGFHGGTWRCGFKMGSIGEASAIIFYLGAYGPAIAAILAVVVGLAVWVVTGNLAGIPCTYLVPKALYDAVTQAAAELF
jgi:hypothetical protein